MPNGGKSTDDGLAGFLVHLDDDERGRQRDCTAHDHSRAAIRNAYIVTALGCFPWHGSPVRLRAVGAARCCAAKREDCVTDQQHPSATPAPQPTLPELFSGFFFIAINGFGGVLPWARRMLVEQRGWLTAEEFLDMLSMCQFVPGPNIVNMSIAVGARFRGVPGTLVCLAGLLIAPMLIVIAIYTLLVQFADAPQVLGALRGMSAVAAGLVITMAVKTALPLIKRRDVRSLACAVLAIVMVGALRVPMLPALAMLIPIGIAAQWLARKPDPAEGGNA